MQHVLVVLEAVPRSFLHRGALSFLIFGGIIWVFPCYYDTLGILLCLVFVLFSRLTSD